MTDSRTHVMERAHAEGILLRRPEVPVGAAPAGLFPLGLDRRRDGVLYVPPSYRPETPAPFVLCLHGAGGNGRNALVSLQLFADERGMILLGPDSRSSTWDVIVGEYGPDVAFIDRALEETFARYAVDRTHVAVEGFSDGASYALSLGITNGDLFTDIIAFSPGFMVPTREAGKPTIFISHGTGDATLRIDVTSRRIVPRLRAAGYDVVYEEFVGPHTVPPGLARQATDLFLAR